MAWSHLGGWITYFVVINMVSFMIMGLDKRFARKGKKRIREKTLMILALAGGSIGVILAMKMFRHKTKHKKFSIGIPVILLLQCFLIYYMTFFLDR